MLPKHLQEKIDGYAKKYKISDKNVIEITMRVEEANEYGIIAPGEAIGIVTAECFGERATQITLNTFHFSGVAEMNITVGLPRLIEIFDARKNPSTPQMEIPLRPKFSKNIDMVRIVAMKIKETLLGEIIQEITINIAKSNIMVILDKKKLKDLDLKPKFVFDKIVAGLKTCDVKEVDGGILIKPKDKEINLSEVYKLKEKAKSIHIGGLKGITYVLPVKNDEGIYIVHCVGSNLKDALELEEADTENIRTNNIFETSTVLGIEAARAAILQESLHVIRGQGIDLNIRHIMLLADVMTRTGIVKGVTRTGISGEKESVIARASFETPIKHIINATRSEEHTSEL